MKIKYWGAEYEKGLTLTADVFDKEGLPIIQGVAMTEVTVNTAIYKTADINIGVLPGIYVTRVVDSSGRFISHEEIIYNGVIEISLLGLNFLTEQELMQLRDALGIDGDKMVARDGQLQKKSESPYNTIIDTTDFN